MKRWLMLSALALLLTGCAQGKDLVEDVTGDQEKVFAGTSDGADLNEDLIEESARKEDVAYVLTSFAGFMEAPELTSYANEVLDQLIAASPRPGLDADVRVVATQAPAAGARPSGLIFVSSGLLKNLESEDELAFVLGHELSHLLLSHYERQWWRKAQHYVAMAGEFAYGISVQTEGEGEVGDLLGATVVTVASRDVIMPAWDRAQEADADAGALDLMKRAGYNQNAAMDVMDLLGRAESGPGGGDVALTGVEETVVESLQIESSDRSGSDDSQSADDPTMPMSLDGLVSKAASELSDDLRRSLGKLRRSHADVEERRAELSAYFRRHYAGQQQPNVRTKAYEQALSASKASKLFDRYQHARRALEVLKQDGRSQQAVREARLAVSGVGENDPYTRKVFGDIRFEQGRHELWARNLELAMKGPEPGLSLYLNLADAYSKLGEPRDALETLKTARERYSAHPMTIVLLIRMHRELGQVKRAQQAVTRCRLQYPRFEERCEKAMRGRSEA